MTSILDVGADIGTLGVLRLPRTVLFGSGQRHALGTTAAGLGSNALICTDARLARSPQLTEILASLTAAGVATEVFADTQPELPVGGVLECMAGLRTPTPDLVIGLGGGSCIDMAKVVALLLAHGGHPRDYYGEFAVPGPIVPVVAVPTTSGTGSEATPVAVLADPERAMKVGISSPHLIPHTAICDPDLTLSCPAGLTAATGADALTHLVEAFTAVRRPATPGLSGERVFIGKSAFTDAVALGGLRLLAGSLLTAHTEPDNATARAHTMQAALAGGIALGVAGTAAAHALQYPLGAITHTPHGVGVGTLLPYVMRFNLPARVGEFAEIGRLIGGADASTPEQDAARAGIAAVDTIIDRLDLPANLAELGLPGDRIGEVAELGLSATRLVQNNPRPLDPAAMLHITRAAYDGDRSFPELEQ
jgi:alcohol dehydrogenase class IV